MGQAIPLPLLDHERGLRQAAGRQSLYDAMLQLYLQHHADTPSKLRTAMQSDRAAAERLAHTLKGSSAQIGATVVEQDAGVLELAIRQGAAAGECAQHLDQLERSLASLLPCVRTRLHGAGSGTSPGGANQP